MADRLRASASKLTIKLNKIRKKSTAPKRYDSSQGTAADGTKNNELEAFKEVLCAGWLQKAGGKGHTVKNVKKRWFVLRGVFISYYTEDPAHTSFKEIEILKGQLFLVGCEVGEITRADGENENAQFTITSKAGKEFILYTCAESTTAIELWRTHISKAVTRATKKFAADVFDGAYLYKKKKNTAWKKRWFLLRGNILQYYTESPKSDSIDGLKGSLDISDIAEIRTDMDPEDLPQLGKRRFCFKFKAENAIYYVGANDDEEMSRWFNLLKQQMTKIATEYNVQSKGAGVMKQYRKSISLDLSKRRDSAASTDGPAPPKPSAPTASTTSANHPLARVFQVLLAMGVKDEDIWEGREFIYPALRHLTAPLIQTQQFPVSIVSFLFPDDPVFHGVSHKAYKLDRRMPVGKVVANVWRVMKVDAPVNNFTVTTLSGYALNESAPLAAYGLGSLLQNWQLKIIPKPKESKKALQSTNTSAANRDTRAATGHAVGAEFPLLVVFDSPKFPVKSQRIVLGLETSIQTVIEKLCASHGVNRADKFALQTFGEKQIPLNSHLTLQACGLGVRFTKWELHLVSVKDLQQQPIELPPGTKYAWVELDDSLTLAEAKEIVKKLDSSLAKSSVTAKAAISSLKTQLTDSGLRIQKLEQRYSKKREEAARLKEELTTAQASVEKLSGSVKSERKKRKQATAEQQKLGEEVSKLRASQSSNSLLDSTDTASGEKPLPSEAQPDVATDTLSSVEQQSDKDQAVSAEVESPKTPSTPSYVALTESAEAQLGSSVEIPLSSDREAAEEQVKGSVDEAEDLEALEAKRKLYQASILADAYLTTIDAAEDPVTPSSLFAAPKSLEEALGLQQKYEVQIRALRLQLAEAQQKPTKPQTPRSPPADSLGPITDSIPEPAEVPQPPPPPPPAPSPPPPPLSPPMPKASKSKKSKTSKAVDTEESDSGPQEKDSGSVSFASAAASGAGLSSSLLESISLRRSSLKKVEVPKTKEKKKDDFRDALEKRFIAMNLDDVEELDDWDEDDKAANFDWQDNADWNDEGVLHI